MNVKITSPKNLDKLFPNPKNSAKALQAGLEAFSKEFVNQVNEGFEGQRTPGGSAWKPNAPWYARWKAEQGKGNKVLVFEGLMKAAALSPATEYKRPDSGSGQDTSLQVILTVADPKARKHEFGLDVPKREFFTVKGSAKDAVTKAVALAFGKAVKASLK